MFKKILFLLIMATVVINSAHAQLINEDQEEDLYLLTTKERNEAILLYYFTDEFTLERSVEFIQNASEIDDIVASIDDAFDLNDEVNSSLKIYIMLVGKKKFLQSDLFKHLMDQDIYSGKYFITPDMNETDVKKFYIFTQIWNGNISITEVEKFSRGSYKKLSLKKIKEGEQIIFKPKFKRVLR